MGLAARLLPVVLSSLLLAAHFLRSGQLGWVAASLAVPLVLLARRLWAVRVTQAGLLAAAAVWTTTAVQLAGIRQASGGPWVRMVLILGSVAALALAAMALLQARATLDRLIRPARGKSP